MNIEQSKVKSIKWNLALWNLKVEEFESNHFASSEVDTFFLEID